VFLPHDAMQSAVGDAIVSRLSVCLSVSDVQVPWSQGLEYFKNNFMAK